MVVSSRQRLEERIRAAGPIPFAEFMEEALYGEAGYYNRQDLAIGPAGDFVTGSAYSDLFAQTTATLLDRLDQALQTPAALLEVGYGNGAHLASVAAIAPQRRVLGWDRVTRQLPEFAGPSTTALSRGSTASRQRSSASRVTPIRIGKRASSGAHRAASPK